MAWLVVLRDEVAAWLPLLFALLLILMVYILWRTLQVMPRVTAAKTIVADSSVSWKDVAGLEEAKEELFEEARKHAPAIVFIDELDAVGSARMGLGFTREQDQTLNQLLVELDGFESREQIVVMGASNRLQDLDAALLRPGRFDRQVLVAAPDLKGRQEILVVHTRGKPLGDDVDLKAIARQTAGLTGAELENIANEAAIFAGRADQQQLRQVDFDD